MARGYPRRSGRPHPAHPLPVRSLPPPHPPRRDRAGRGRRRPRGRPALLHGARCTTTATTSNSVTSASVARAVVDVCGRRDPAAGARRHAAVRAMPRRRRVDRVGQHCTHQLDLAGARGRATRAREARRRDATRSTTSRSRSGSSTVQDHTVTLARDGDRAPALDGAGFHHRGAGPLAEAPKRVRPLGRRRPSPPTTPRPPSCSGGRAASG